MPAAAGVQGEIREESSPNVISSTLCLGGCGSHGRNVSGLSKALLCGQTVPINLQVLQFEDVWKIEGLSFNSW